MLVFEMMDLKEYLKYYWEMQHY